MRKRALQSGIATHSYSPAQVRQDIVRALPSIPILTQVVAVVALLFSLPQRRDAGDSGHGVFIQSVVFRAQVLLLLSSCSIRRARYVVSFMDSFRSSEFLALV
jgi:hypothetical protein